MKAGKLNAAGLFKKRIMSKLKLKGKELRAIGYPEGPVISIAMQVMEKHYKHGEKEDVMNILRQILADPAEYTGSAVLGLIAKQLIPEVKTDSAVISLNDTGVPFNVFGADYIEKGALHQMDLAARLPVALAGALMPILVMGSPSEVCWQRKTPSSLMVWVSILGAGCACRFLI
jgi:hypothetical protein